MSYPRSIYHKSYDPHAKDGESELKKHCRIAHSKEDHEKYGVDWGYDAKELKEESKPDVVEEEVEAKPKRGRK